MKEHRGPLILPPGISSLVACSPLGIAAWIMDSCDLKEMDAGTMDPAGRSSTNAGKICGIMATILLVISIVFCGLVFVSTAVLRGGHWCRGLAGFISLETAAARRQFAPR